MKRGVSGEVASDVEIVVRLISDDAYYKNRARRYKETSLFGHLSTFVMPILAGTLFWFIGLAISELAGWTLLLVDLIDGWANRDAYLILVGAISALLSFCIAAVFSANLRVWVIERANLRQFRQKVIDNFLFLKKLGLHPPDNLLIDADGIVELFEQDDQSVEVRIELARVFGVCQGYEELDPICAFWSAEALREALNAHHTVSSLKKQA